MNHALTHVVTRSRVANAFSGRSWSATIHPLFAKADWLYCRAGEIPADDRWYIAAVIRHLCHSLRF